jgi:hypothetical protein
MRRFVGNMIRKSAHNLDRLLRVAQHQTQIFSKAPLASRKQGNLPKPPNWLDDYLRSAYVPKPSDFRRLRSRVATQRNIYARNCRGIRHYFAHKRISDPTEVATLFARTNIREIQRMVVFLLSLHEALWELLVNGRKPTLRPHRYSVKQMRTKPSPRGGRYAVHEWIIHEAEKFLTETARNLRREGNRPRRKSVSP